MRIVFIGCVEMSCKVLQKIIEIGGNVVGVCTKESSKFNNDFVDLAALSKGNNISFQYADDINSQSNVNWIKKLHPDIIFCIGWSSLIKTELLLIPTIGVIGYHPSKLPLNRGRHPLIWPFVLNMTKSASTFFFMDEGADKGDILSQKDFEILYEDDARSLYNKVASIALRQVEELYLQLLNHSYVRIPQDHSNASVWRKRSFHDGAIDFRMTSKAIYNLVRGLSDPYAGAHINYKGKEIKIWKVKEVKCRQNNIVPGTILDTSENSFTVKVMDQAIKLVRHDFEFIPKKGEYL